MVFFLAVTGLSRVYRLNSTHVILAAQLAIFVAPSLVRFSPTRTPLLTLNSRVERANHADGDRPVLVVDDLVLAGNREY